MSYNVKTGLYEGFIYKIWNDINDKLYIGQTITTIQDRWHGHYTGSLSEKRCKSALYDAMRKYGRDNFHIEAIESVFAETREELINKLNVLEQQYIQHYKSLTKQNGYNVELGGNNKTVAGRKVNKYTKDLVFIEQYDSVCEAGRKNNIDGSTIYNLCAYHEYYTAGGFAWAFDGEEPLRADPNKKKKPSSRIYIKKEKVKKPYKSKAMTKEEKYAKRLENLLVRFRNERIVAYNAYGEIIKMYDNCLDAIINLPLASEELYKNLTGKNLTYNKMILRYESDSFDLYPMSKNLCPISMYDLQGNHIRNFECIKDAEEYVGCCKSDISKTIKRGGSCKGYLFSEYNKPLIRKVHRDRLGIEMLDDNGNVVKDFDSKREVINYINEEYNIADCHYQLNNAIKNNTKYKNYYWKIKPEFKVG